MQFIHNHSALQVRKGRSAFGALAAFGIAALGLVLLWQQINGLNFANVRTAFQNITPLQWMLALGATALSFAALGQYDAFWHRVLGTGISPKRARRTGMVAIAIGQTIGLTSVTASFVRWRCLPEVPPVKTAALSASVSSSFMICWAAFALPALWVVLQPLSAYQVPPQSLLIAALCMIVICTIGARKAGVRPRDALKLVAWVAVDLAATASVLWLLLPADSMITWGMMCAAFTLALGAGLVCNSPGGVGPFEMVLLTALPASEMGAVLAVILAYRVVYFLVPFICALPFAIWPFAIWPFAIWPFAIWPEAAKSAPRIAGPADWGLAQQSGRMRRFGQSWAHVLTPFPGYAVSIGDLDPQAITPNGRAVPPQGLRAMYKAGPRLAQAARAAGWCVSRISSEAVLNPMLWSLKGSRKSRLRHALRRAEGADVSVVLAGPDLPLADMARVADHWAKAHGGELGATMGRYDPAYVATQSVFLIYVAGALRGFVTFHSAKDWSLDLIRCDGALPTGAIQTAVVAALEAAQAAGVTRFSLAAVPAKSGVLARWSKGHAGLIQFKRQFDPQWVPRYFVTRTAAEHMFVAGFLTFAIQRPIVRAVQKIMWRAHVRLASFGFANPRDNQDTRAMNRERIPHESRQECADRPT